MSNRLNITDLNNDVVLTDLTIKIDVDNLELYESLCKQRGSTVEQEINCFVTQQIQGVIFSDEDQGEENSN